MLHTSVINSCGTIHLFVNLTFPKATLLFDNINYILTNFLLLVKRATFIISRDYPKAILI